jgi:DNA-directed RNA polymerase beta subunit
MSEDLSWEIIKSFFKQKGLVNHQISSYNMFLHHGIQRIIDEEPKIIIENNNQKYIVEISEVYIPPPAIIDHDRKLKNILPSECRKRDLNYESDICCNIKETLIENKIITDENGYNSNVDVILESYLHRRIPIGKIPIMLHCYRCNLSNLSELELMAGGECEKDFGGYFIIKGNERVLINQIRAVHNKVFVLLQKPDDKFKYIAEMRSISEETGHSVLIQAKVDWNDKNIIFSLPYIKDSIPIGIIFKALGFIQDQEIIDLISLDSEKAQKFYRFILRDSYFIKSQSDALKYIGNFAIHTINKEKREAYAWQVVETELFPHLGIAATIKEKAIMLGKIINKLLSTTIGLRGVDNRDNYSNKRVETAGTLVYDLFKTLYKRYVNTIKAQLEKKKQRLDVMNIISRLKGITQGIRHCFPKGTLITMANGLSYPIEKLSEKGGEYVLGWNGKGLIPSKQTGLIKQGIKNTLKLTFENGKTLICTPDHKILVNHNNKPTWIEAKNIIINSRIISSIQYPEDIINSDEKDWKLNIEYKTKTSIKNITFGMDTNINRNKTLALARIIGYILSDGHIQKLRANGGSVYMGTMLDVNNFIFDYKLITGKTPIIRDRISQKWGKIYQICLRTELTHILREIDGIIIGKKSIQEISLPTFILNDNCPISIIREFLGGLFGGDGHCPHLDIRDNTRTCITGVAFSWTTHIDHINNLKLIFEQLRILLSKIGINNTLINGPYKPSSEQTNKLYYRLHLNPNSSFQKYIGFRYCIHKSFKLAIATEYWLLVENIKKQHNNLKNNQKITIKNALEIAQNELKSNEYILNNYYSLSNTKDISKRREKNRNNELKNLQTKYGVPDAKKFIEDMGMGILKCFQKEYICERDCMEYPYYTSKLCDIREHKTIEVYDISVNETHSFLANGNVVHNCFATGNWGVQKNAYIRTGVSQVLSRLSYGGTLSHLRRLTIPVGKEGKNTEIRQIHSSQFGFICPSECFDPNTPIILWDGNIKLAHEIKVGDILIEDNGLGTKVKSTCKGTTIMYEIQQNKNSLNYTVTDNHILTLKIKQHKRIRPNNNKFQIIYFDKKKLKYIYKSFNIYEEANIFKNNIIDDDILDITIANYLKLSPKIQSQLYGFRCEKVNWPKQEIKLDPYLLGMWLGDGLSDGFGFASADQELIDYYINWGKNNDATIKHLEKYKYGISSTINNSLPGLNCNGTEEAPLKKLLKIYNLVKNKHIPKEYLLNDRDTRLKLLAGLIDTDGNVRANGHEIRISQGPKNTQIIVDTLYLTRSLGFSCHLNTGKSQWTSDSGKKKFSTYNELSITGEFLYEIPTLLPRKKLYPFKIEKSKSNCASYLQSPIKVIKKGIGPFVGWQLEGNGRFLLEDFTVAHNTPEGAAAGIVLNYSNFTTVTIKIPTVLVKNILENILYPEHFISIDLVDITKIKSLVPVYLNGILIAFTQDGESTTEEVQKLKNLNMLDKSISCTYDSFDDEINIYSDDGRLIRPLFTLTENKLNITENDEIDWNKLVEQDKIRYLDHNEIESSVIAMDFSYFSKQHNNYCEINPAMLLGVMGSIIPFSDHTQSPRNCYQCIDLNSPVLMYNNTYTKIKDIIIGDQIITIDPISYTKSITTVIKHIVRPTDKNIYTITTISGRKITATYDHKILTTDGWIELKNLKIYKSLVAIVCPSLDNIENFIKNEYTKYIFYQNSLVGTPTGIINLSNKITFNDWYNLIIIKNNTLFIPIDSIVHHPNILIADLTTASNNHSFVAGDNFCVHNCSMGKQALGVYANSYLHRTDTIVHVIESGQRPLVSTKAANLMGFDDMPYGVNVIVAVLTYGGLLV